jgi:hypothetical protein
LAIGLFDWSCGSDLLNISDKNIIASQWFENNFELNNGVGRYSIMPEASEILQDNTKN